MPQEGLHWESVSAQSTKQVCITLVQIYDGKYISF